MVERGDATAEDVDTAMELGAGYRELPPTLSMSAELTSSAMGVSTAGNQTARLY